MREDAIAPPGGQGLIERRLFRELGPELGERDPEQAMTEAGHHCVRPGRGKCFTPTLSSKGAAW